MSQSLFLRVKALLAIAGHREDYERAKAIAEGCTPREQMDLIDCFIAARKRLREEGQHV